MSTLPEDRQERGIPWLTGIACVLCVGLTLGYWITGRNDIGWGHFPPEAIWQGRYGALVTSTFLHGDPLHLFFNVVMLFRFGGVVERALGHLEWAVFCLGAACVASSVQLAFFGDTGIGASGVVYALFGLTWGARRFVPAFREVASDETVRFLLGWIVLTFALTEMGMMRIANGAHIGGLLFGLAVAGLFIGRQAPVWRRIAAATVLLALIGVTVLSATYLPWSARWQAWHETRQAAP